MADTVESAAGHIEVLPFETGFGAELRGLDLSRPLSQDAFDAWHAAFEAHSVLVVRNQTFTDAQHVAFSQWFGRLEEFEDPKDQAEGFKTIIRVSNIDKYTGRIKSLDDLGHKSFTLGTSDWHTDSSFRKVMSKASLLFAREVPPEGGDTNFASTSQAWEALPAETKRRIEGLTVIHDFEQARRRFGLPPRAPEIRAKLPPVSHPLVAQLPDGRKALLLGMHASHIEGMDADESRALLDELTAFATQPQFTYRHRWRVGDLVMWDNRCTMHRAMPYALERDRRLLHRTTIAGESALLRA
ncbi:MAG: TauD/TfdA dioxygenase family protein [Beijerinckiaceae bacterium]